MSPYKEKDIDQLCSFFERAYAQLKISHIFYS